MPSRSRGQGFYGVVVGAARLLPPGRNGRNVHVSTIVRAIIKGQLEALRVGSRWVTSVEALQRWAERQTAEMGGKTPSRTRSGRIEADESADRRLEELGM